MNRQVKAPSPPGNRRTPLLAEKDPAVATTGRRRKRIGEVAGGTAAECAAVWCCCPCAAMNVLVLALYKLPAGLCRRAWAHRRRKNGNEKTVKRQRLDGLLLQRGASPGRRGPTIEELERRRAADYDGVAGADVAFGDEEEDEMWARFYGSGFWRSPSCQR